MKFWRGFARLGEVLGRFGVRFWGDFACCFEVLGRFGEGF